MNATESRDIEVAQKCPVVRGVRAPIEPLPKAGRTSRASASGQTPIYETVVPAATTPQPSRACRSSCGRRCLGGPLLVRPAGLAQQRGHHSAKGRWRRRQETLLSHERAVGFPAEFRCDLRVRAGVQGAPSSVVSRKRWPELERQPTRKTRRPHQRSGTRAAAPHAIRRPARNTA